MREKKKYLDKKKIIVDVLRGGLSKAQSVELLGKTVRTINRYIRRYLKQGVEGLSDKRRSNYRKLTGKDEKRIFQCKLEGRHRSARFIRDRLGLLVHEEPRKVQRTGAVSYYGHYYRVPDRYIGRRVWTNLKGRTLSIECAGEKIVR